VRRTLDVPSRPAAAAEPTTAEPATADVGRPAPGPTAAPPGLIALTEALPVGADPDPDQLELF
jgi:hypothetical protein